MKSIDGSFGHFQGQESGSVFSCVQNTLASECYIQSLPVVLKDKRSCFSEGKWSAGTAASLSYVCPLEAVLETAYR